MSLILSFLRLSNSLRTFLGDLEDSHVMSVPQGHGDQIFATFDIDENSDSNFLAMLKGTEGKSSDISSHLVKSPGATLDDHVAHGDVHVLLVGVDFLNVGQSVVHVVVVDDV